MREQASRKRGGMNLGDNDRNGQQARGNLKTRAENQSKKRGAGMGGLEYTKSNLKSKCPKCIGRFDTQLNIDMKKQ